MGTPCEREPAMCLELSDDFIDELGMGRLPGTEEQRQSDDCGECQERVREWITILRQVLGEGRRGSTPQNKVEPIRSRGLKKRCRSSKRTPY